MKYEDKEIKDWIRNLWVLWAAFLYVQFIYIGLGYMKQDYMPFFVEAKLPMGLVRFGFFIIALTVLCSAYFHRRRWLKSQNIKINPKIIQRARRTNLPPIFLQYSTDVLYSFCVSSSCGLLGLAYFSLSRDWQTFCVFIAISVITIIHFRPKLKEFEQYLRSAGNSS